MHDEPTLTDRHGDAITCHASPYSLPDHLDGLCLFLDLDGTLLDLAEAPDAVVVPPDLQTDLTKLSHRLGGALAVVTGRPLAFVDRLFPGNGLFLAGLHGAELRSGDQEIVPAATADLRFEAAKKRLRHAVSRWRGVLVEDKGRAVALHYRQAPEMEIPVKVLMQKMAPSLPGWTLQPGKFVVEFRPAGQDKGSALKFFMERNPFAGRLPLAVGDDVTDEAMFAAANAIGGFSVRVGSPLNSSYALGRIATPDQLRRWIAKLAG